MLFSLRKHHLDLFFADTALKVSRSLCCFTTSISHGVENNFPGCGVLASLMLFLNNHFMIKYPLSETDYDQQLTFSF